MSASTPPSTGSGILTTGSWRVLLPDVFYRNPMPSAVHEVSEEARYIEVNHAWLAFFGLKREQVLGRALREIEIWASDEQRRRLGSLLRQQAQMRDCEGRARRGDGSEADILLSWEPFEHAGRRYMLSVFTDITGRKRAERLLRHSEERFSAIFEASPLALTVARRSDGVYLQVNRAYERLMGYQRDEVIGKSTLELGVWADPESRERLIHRLERDGAGASIEARVRKKDGSEFEAIFSAALVEIDGVEVIHGTVQDISDLRRIARLKTQSEQRFELVIETSPLAMTFTRLEDGVYLNVNRACEELLGYSRKEMIGKSSVELGVWVDPGVRDQIRGQLAGGRQIASLETQARTRGGSVLDIFFSATVIELDGVPVLHGTVFDLTHIKQATQQKLVSEERFSRMFRASPGAIVITRSSDGAFVEWNDAWHEQFGYRREDIIGRTALEIGMWPDPAERERLAAAVRRGGAVRGFETRLTRRSGEIADVILSVEPVELDGADNLIVCVADVTERKRAERMRARSEARFTQVFQVGPHPIVFSRASDGRDIQVNDAWHQMFGYSREDIEGQSSNSLNLWVDPGFRERRRQLLAQGESARDIETQMRTKSGAIVDVLISSENADLDGEIYVVSMITDITARRSAARQIEYLATRDYLTGLPNRLLFGDRLRQGMTKALRGGQRIALMFIDLDRFKDVNDSLGHQVGDSLLTEVAARLGAAVRGGDTVARQGGDEFLVMIDGLAQGEDARPVAQKLVDALAEPFHLGDKVMTVSCSIGVSIFPDDAQNEEDLMRHSDLAMYSVKESGRNDYRFFSADMNQRLVERMALEARLREALGRGEFALHFQPKLDLREGHVTGCEALLRWHHPEQGLILPGRFIGIAEETRLILPIGEWVLRQACAEMRRWIDKGFKPVPVAVNLSVYQFDAGLPEIVASALANARLTPEMLEIEITETVMMHNTVAHLDIMRRLKALGVRLTLDDFGTGFSSLSYLKQMDVDTLKIDQSFVRELALNSEDRSIVAAIIAMAGEFGMKTVAEGVESEAQAEALKLLHCDEYQGFLFSRAVPVDEFEMRYLLAA